MRWLILAAAFLPTITIGITYGMSYWHHDIHQEVPFISGTIDYAPESCIGTFGLSVSAWLQCLIMIVKYNHEAKIIHLKQTNNIAHLRRVNIASLVLGVIAVLGLVGVTSFQYHLLPTEHLSSAATFFTCITIYIIMISWLDNVLNQESKLVLIFRIILGILVFLAYIPMIVLGAFQKVLDRNLQAVAEITCVGLVLSFFLTYLSEFSRLSFTVHVTDHKWKQYIPQTS